MTAITNETLNNIFYPENPIEEKPKDFSLPIRWDGGDYYKWLYLLLKQYRERVDKALPEQDDETVKDDLRTVCYGVCLAVSESFHGNPSKAYDAVKSVLDLLTEKYPCYVDEEELMSKEFPLFRAVDVHDRAIHDRKRVFHVPFNLRSKMATTRYSIPGYPSLYLGTSLELNCMEIGKDPYKDNVMAARYEYQKEKNLSDIEYLLFVHQFLRSLRIIDLSVKPQDFGNREHKESLRLKNLEEENKKNLFFHPGKYLLWYPLIAACSFIRAYRDDPYSVEYIVPQLVMQWVKEIKDDWPRDRITYGKVRILGGIRYFSCVSDKASEMGINYAFSSFGSDIWLLDDVQNYCPILATNFVLTEPIYISEYKDTEECQNALINKRLTRIGRIDNKAIAKKIRENNGAYSVPNGEDNIPEYAFSHCEDLTRIEMPDSVTTIGDSAFDSCSNLLSIIIPSSVSNIGKQVFNNCKNLKEIIVAQNNKKYYSFGNCLIERKNEKVIYGCKMSTLPKNAKEIEDQAFAYCTGLTEIYMPDSVTSIGNYAFFGCTGLLEIGLPNNVTNIGNGAFNRCAGLTGIRIPNGITSIKDGTFDSCTGLTEIIIPYNVTVIGNWVFDGCKKLTKVNIPDNVKSIGDRAFNNCVELTRIVIPDSVTSIGDWAFAGCTNLDISVPGRFRDLDNHAFDGCHSVTYRDE